jgi:hypothetical protein
VSSVEDCIETLISLHLELRSHTERFQILVKVDMNITVLWDVATRSPANCYQHLGGTYCIYLQGRRANTLKMEAELFSEMSVANYQTKKRHNRKTLLFMSMMLFSKVNRYEFTY